LLKRNDWRLYTLEGEGKPLKKIEEQIVSNNAYYKGERNFLILHPELDYYATMSKKGKCLSIHFKMECSFLTRVEFFAFVSPHKKILYIGKESGIFALDFEENSLFKIRDEPSRVIRISGEGGYIFILKTGGENFTFHFET